MGKLRDSRNATKETALIDKIPRIEIELAGLSEDIADLEAYVDQEVAAVALIDALEGGVIRLNGQALTSDAIVLGTKNGSVVGPIEVPDGMTLTIEDGGVLVIL